MAFLMSDFFTITAVIFLGTVPASHATARGPAVRGVDEGARKGAKQRDGSRGVVQPVQRIGHHEYATFQEQAVYWHVHASWGVRWVQWGQDPSSGGKGGARWSGGRGPFLANIMCE